MIENGNLDVFINFVFLSVINKKTYLSGSRLDRF
jgi:hypothetical protein